MQLVMIFQANKKISDIYIGGLADTTTNLAPPLWQSEVQAILVEEHL